MKRLIREADLLVEYGLVEGVINLAFNTGEEIYDFALTVDTGLKLQDALRLIFERAGTTPT